MAYAGAISESRSTSGSQIVPGMMNVYNQLMGLNQRNYANMLAAYQGGLAGIQGSLGGIYSGYNALSNQALRQMGLGGGGWGIAAPAAADIKAEGIQKGGEIQQRMINAGLGNTTVLANLAQQQAGVTQRAYERTGSSLAEKATGYTTQIGLAGLGARMQGTMGLANYIGGALGNIGMQFQNPTPNMVGTFSTSTSTGGGGGGGGGGFGHGGGGTASAARMPQMYQYPAGGGGGGVAEAYGGSRGVGGTFGETFGGGGAYSVNYGGGGGTYGGGGGGEAAAVGMEEDPWANIYGNFS